MIAGLKNQHGLDIEASIRKQNSSTIRSAKDDPNFMRSYFTNSRLHFIGSWRGRFVELSARLQSEYKYADLQADYTRTMQARGTKRVVLHVDMDCFFVSVLTRNRPDLRGLPVAVAHTGNKDGSSEVSSCNYEARVFGVSAGMFMAYAKSLCPELHVLQYNFDEYTEVSEQIYRIFFRYCSDLSNNILFRCL
jgi:DNA repair protein REV1